MSAGFIGHSGSRVPSALGLIFQMVYTSSVATPPPEVGVRQLIVARIHVAAGPHGDRLQDMWRLLGSEAGSRKHRESLKKT